MLNVLEILGALFITMVIVGGIMFASGDLTITTNLIDACEAELPRNQHCVLQAVPESEG